VCEGRIQGIPKPPPNNHSKYQNKEEYTYTIIINIKGDKNTPKRKKNEKEKI